MKPSADIKALSFDLDNTLYANDATIETAEAVLDQWLAEQTQQQNQAPIDWRQLKQKLLDEQPELHSDMTAWRMRTLETGFATWGLNAQNATQLAEKGVHLFVQARSKVPVQPETHAMLAQLQQKFPLVVITNGNLDLEAAGIASYFKFVYKATLDSPRKPSPFMFEQACHDLAIAPEHLLHIGDHPEEDVLAAQHCGCQTAWIAPDAPENPNTWHLRHILELKALVK
jgi:HAD superfamily hydrolase (TIGR01549 family)